MKLENYMKMRFAAVWIILFLPFGIQSINAGTTDPKKENTDTIKKVQPLDLGTIELFDDPYVMRLDSLLSYNFFEMAGVGPTSEFLDTSGENLDLIPNFADTIYQKRLEILDRATPFDLSYNPEVKRYIEVYSQRRREQLSRMLGLAQYYFPMFEEHLDKYNLPLEIKYLAIVESALNPLARSRVGATGLWQFMYATGRINGLQVNSYIDERCDPVKSTEAACKYLSQLYNIFGDWNLALAAYNSGPGNVNKAIRRSGGKKDYWQIRSFLPRETQGYVPAFIAVNYIMNHAEEHLIYPSNVKDSYLLTDTILVKDRLSFEQISSLVNISEEDLMFLNPAYRYKIIPKDDEGYALILPASQAGLFVANEDSIYSLARKNFAQVENQEKPTEIPEKVVYRVKRGDALGVIAERYGVSISSIKAWNGLRSNTIQIGERLTIYPSTSYNTSAQASSSSSKSSNSGDNYINYRVNNGETFYSIARKYPGVSAENIMEWNGIKNARHLKSGMKLKIYTRT